MGSHQAKRVLCSQGSPQPSKEENDKKKKKFANYEPDKELTSRIYKELKNSQPQHSI